MDPNVITTLIQNVGFPIAVCIYFAWDSQKKDARHREEIAKLSEALNNNTLVMNKLVDRLDNSSNEGVM